MFDTNEIPAVQFMRPDGREVHGEIHIKDDALYHRANGLIEQGCRFTLEVLTTNQISLAVEGPDPAIDDEVGDIGIAVFHNAPGAIEANIEKAIRQAEATLNPLTGE